MELDASAIAQHVDEALESPLFARAERQARFLRFVVAAALQTPSPLVREFDIARAVYDRRDDYDPRIDPIVRVEAARLRARLREYYELAPPARVRIDLPKGRYLPRFTFLGLPGPLPQATRAVVLVQPFRILGSREEDAGFADGLTEEVVHALTQLQSLRVMVSLPSGEVSSPRPDLRLDATVRRAGVDVRVTVRLVDPSAEVAVMSNRYALSVDDVFGAQEALAARICADVTCAALSPSVGPEEQARDAE